MFYQRHADIPPLSEQGGIVMWRYIVLAKAVFLSPTLSTVLITREDDSFLKLIYP